MASALSAIHSVLDSATPITDRDIKDALWNYFFDVESSIAYLLGELYAVEAARDQVLTQLAEEQHKKEAARGRAGGEYDPCLSVPLSRDAGAVGGTTATGPLPTPRDLPTSLSTLSLDSTSPTFSLPALSPAAASMSKLAAKVAAGKVARLAGAGAQGAGTKGGEDAVPTMGALPTTEASGKKVSKLQLKMLASQAARSTKAAPSPVPRPASPPPTPPVSLAPSPPIPAALPSLRAFPSSFAATLSPRSPPPAVLLSIEGSLARDSAIASAGIPAFASPSPDDVVLFARKGTALAGVTPKRK